VRRPEKEKPEKAPLDPRGGGRAKTDSPATWGSFEEAMKSFESNKNLHGLGFVFTHSDPFAFVDLDDARDAKTGEIGAWAQEIVDRLDSYTEVSPSGTGLRIIIEADSPGPAKRRGKVEIYASGQYATLTGCIIGRKPKPVANRQGELADVYQLVFGKVEPDEAANLPAASSDDPKLIRVRGISDDELVAKATNAANGAKFVKLWTADSVGDRSAADAALCSILAYWTRADAERVDRLFRRSQLFRPKWDERRGATTYGERTVAFAVKGVTALFDPDLDSSTDVEANRNDMTNAVIFVQLHGDDFRWCEEWDAWLRWDGHGWGRGTAADASAKLAREDVRAELLRRAVNLQGKEATAALKWANSAGDAYRLNAFEGLACHRLSAPLEKFDADPYLLACANGVVDLRTGELRDGQRADWCTRTTGLAYSPKGECPTWDRFLRDITEGDKDLVAYLWRVIGYTLTGDVTERAFFLFHGEGRNGKSTFVETLKALLGAPGTGYAQKARFSTFLRKNFAGGANDDVAHLAGARAVVASEADERMPLDVALVKELTGGDTHRARHLYGREFEFNPQFKLFLVTNKIPPIHETTYAIWDRLHYVEFTWRVPDNKVDRGLPLKLLGELSGILTKAVRACLEWQRTGLEPPPRVLKAGEKLYTEMDTMGEFLSECCETGNDNFKTTHKSLYHVFFHWSKDQGFLKPPSSKALASYLREKRYAEQNGTGNVKMWCGIRPTAKTMTEAGEL
jgi:putative DNA primase/helicase